MCPAFNTPLTTASKPYIALTQLRYRILFALVMLPAICFLFLPGNMPELLFRLTQYLLQIPFVVLSAWTVWASLYRCPTYGDALKAPHRPFTLLSWVWALIFLFMAMELRISIE